MIDLTNAFNEGVNNIKNWRNRYDRDEYPHKIIINIMYRAYTMNFVWQDFLSNKLKNFDNFEDSVEYMEKYYSDTAIKRVNESLTTWLRAQPGERIGNATFSFFDEVATDAENNPKDLRLVEDAYLLHLLEDKLVLYWIAMRIAGESPASGIERLTGYQVEVQREFTYDEAKNAFGELMVHGFLVEKGANL